MLSVTLIQDVRTFVCMYHSVRKKYVPSASLFLRLATCSYFLQHILLYNTGTVPYVRWLGGNSFLLSCRLNNKIECCSNFYFLVYFYLLGYLSTYILIHQKINSRTNLRSILSRTLFRIMSELQNGHNGIIYATDNAIIILN